MASVSLGTPAPSPRGRLQTWPARTASRITLRSHLISTTISYEPPLTTKATMLSRIATRSAVRAPRAPRATMTPVAARFYSENAFK